MASTAIGTFMTSSVCHGRTERTRPPTVGPIAMPTRPTVAIREVARISRFSWSNKRKQSAMVPGAVIAAVTPIAARTAMSWPGVPTNSTIRLARANRVRPISMIRRVPYRSAIAPKAIIRPPKSSEYPEVIHCRAAAEASSSFAMVGRATLSTELSSISTRKTTDSPRMAGQTARSEVACAVFSARTSMTSAFMAYPLLE